MAANHDNDGTKAHKRDSDGHILHYFAKLTDDPAHWYVLQMDYG